MDAHLTFVTAANLRAHASHLALSSRFHFKCAPSSCEDDIRNRYFSGGGNIILGIATTNAIVDSLIVLEALKLLRGKRHGLRVSHLYRAPNARLDMLQVARPDPTVPSCFVCEKGTAHLAANAACL